MGQAATIAAATAANISSLANQMGVAAQSAITAVSGTIDLGGAVEIDTTQLVAVQAAMNDLKAAAQQIQANANLAAAGLPSFDELGTAPLPPTLATLALPAAPTYTNPVPSAPTLAPVTLPAAPTLQNISVPALVLPTAPAQPTLTAVAAPAAKPSIALPVAPNIVIPTFSATYTPPTALTALDVSLQRLAAQTSPTAWADESRLYTQIMALATAPSPLQGNEEQALYERARLRLTNETLDQKRQVSSRFAALNYPTPAGAELIALQRVEEKMAEQMTAINSDLAEMKLKAAIAHVQWKGDLLVRYDQMALDWLKACKDRMLQESTEFVRAQISAYQASLQMFDVALKEYQTKASVFETQVRALDSVISVYRSQLEGAKLQGELYMQDVEIYKSMVEAQKSTVAIYSAQIAAFEASISGEVAKLNAVKIAIEAQGQTVNLYESQMRGAEAASRVGGQQIDIYKTQVGAWEVQQRAGLALFDAQLGLVKTQANLEELKMTAYRESMGAFGQKMEVLSKKMNVYVERAKIINEGGQAVVHAAGVVGDTLAKTAGISIEVGRSTADLNARLAIAQGDVWVHQQEARSRAYSLLANTIGGQIAAVGQTGAGLLIETATS